MGTLLNRSCVALLAAACTAAGAQTSDRHHLTVELETSYVAAESSLESWTAGGLSKLRRAPADDGFTASRLFAEYRGRIVPGLWTKVVADYVDDASAGLDLVEAYVDWQPTSRGRHRLKVGAFYPPLSLENGARGWNSPFTYSFSAINTWLGEEIRPIGAEWSMRRRVGYANSPHEIAAFAAGFYGNDPAGTLLFWRGWALHDRQTRLNDRVPMPPLPIWSSTGAIVGAAPQTVEPFEEIDDRPGAYAGVEWRYGRRALLQLAQYDNRADPYGHRDGQWGWQTAFTQVAAQVSLPAALGLIVQWLEGDTDWIAGARANGTLSPGAELVEDRFEAKFVMLTRLVRGLHRVSLRYDDFAMTRAAIPAAPAERGHAWALAYRYERSARFTGGVEWLRVRTRRDLWSDFYGAADRASEREIRFQLNLRLDNAAAR
jgi:hypothetical protein